jgi:hypothetical protein
MTEHTPPGCERQGLSEKFLKNLTTKAPRTPQINRQGRQDRQVNYEKEPTDLCAAGAFHRFPYSHIY